MHVVEQDRLLVLGQVVDAVGADQGVEGRKRPLEDLEEVRLGEAQRDHVGRREDLNAVIVEMIAELHAGHNRAGGGDTHKENGVKSGLLGANLAVENGHYRIKRVYSGENWNPFLKAPLAQVGATLPNNFEIKAAKLRGVESQGMLCSGAELELSEDSDGLMTGNSILTSWPDRPSGQL